MAELPRRSGVTSVRCSRVGDTPRTSPGRSARCPSHTSANPQPQRGPTTVSLPSWQRALGLRFVLGASCHSPLSPNPATAPGRNGPYTVTLPALAPRAPSKPPSVDRTRAVSSVPPRSALQGMSADRTKDTHFLGIEKATPATHESMREWHPHLVQRSRDGGTGFAQDV